MTIFSSIASKNVKSFVLKCMITYVRTVWIELRSIRDDLDSFNVFVVRNVTIFINSPFLPIAIL